MRLSTAKQPTTPFSFSSDAAGSFRRLLGEAIAERFSDQLAALITAYFAASSNTKPADVASYRAEIHNIILALRRTIDRIDRLAPASRRRLKRPAPEGSVASYIVPDPFALIETTRRSAAQLAAVLDAEIHIRRRGRPVDADARQVAISTAIVLRVNGVVLEVKRRSVFAKVLAEVLNEICPSSPQAESLLPLLKLAHQEVATISPSDLSRALTHARDGGSVIGVASWLIWTQPFRPDWLH